MSIPPTSAFASAMRVAAMYGATMSLVGNQLRLEFPLPRAPNFLGNDAGQLLEGGWEPVAKDDLRVWCHFGHTRGILAQLLAKPVKSLPFDKLFRNRILNTLARMGVTTIGELIRQTPLNLMSWKNFGDKSLAELTRLLDLHGLSLTSDEP